MLAYRDGDAAAFDALYARHRGPVYRFLRRQTAGVAVADELFQDVWMAVINARTRYEVSAKFTTWLYRIAHHRLVDHYRASGRLVAFESPLPEDEDGTPLDSIDPDAETPEQHVLRRETTEHLVAAIEALPPAQREAFLLAADGELTVADIARVTGVPFETAKSRLRYAYARLRQVLSDSRACTTKT